MFIVFVFATANPAPIEIADTAFHVIATTSLLSARQALRTVLYFIPDCPLEK
jgi:hypothetical protein